MAQKGMTAGILAIARALEGMTVHNGHMDWFAGLPKIVVDIADSAAAGSTGPFAITQTGSAELTVRAGDWYRNGAQTIAGDTVIGSLTANTYYIKATLSGGDNPEVTPTTLTISATTTWAPPADVFNIVTLLGIVVMGATEIQSITQTWRGGHIDDCASLPDSAAGSPNQYSLENRTDADHVGERALYNFESESGVSSAAVAWGSANNQYMFLAKHRNDPAKTLKYMYPTTLDVVTNVSYNPATGILAQTKRTVTILDYGSEATTTIEQAEGCS